MHLQWRQKWLPAGEIRAKLTHVIDLGLALLTQVGAFGLIELLELAVDGANMLQLAYLSAASRSPTPALMKELCEQAFRNNAKHEITGMLMARGGRFLQVLEGPKEATEDTFLRIIVDDRHHALLLLSRKMVTARQFGRWSMAEIDDVHEQDVMIGRVRRLIEGAPAHLRTVFGQAFCNRNEHGGPAGVDP